MLKTIIPPKSHKWKNSNITGYTLKNGDSQTPRLSVKFLRQKRL